MHRNIMIGIKCHFERKIGYNDTEKKERENLYRKVKYESWNQNAKISDIIYLWEIDSRNISILSIKLRTDHRFSIFISTEKKWFLHHFVIVAIKRQRTLFPPIYFSRFLFHSEHFVYADFSATWKNQQFFSIFFSLVFFYQ